MKIIKLSEIHSEYQLTRYISVTVSQVLVGFN